MYTAIGKDYLLYVYKKDFQLKLKNFEIKKIHKPRLKKDRLHIMKDIILSYVANETSKNDKYI